MPNWCNNRLNVLGDNETIQRFHDAVDATPELSLLNTFVPRPDDQELDWWNWSHENWGCKWPDKNELTDFRTDEITYHGETPWGPPITGYLKVSAMWPTLQFILSYDEIGMNFMGAVVFSDGEIIFSVEDSLNDELFDDEWDTLFDAWNDRIDETYTLAYHAYNEYKENK